MDDIQGLTEELTNVLERMGALAFPAIKGALAQVLQDQSDLARTQRDFQVRVQKLEGRVGRLER